MSVAHSRRWAVIRKAVHALRIFEDERGATAIEYAFIVLLIGIALVGALTALGTSLADFFEVPGRALNISV